MNRSPETRQTLLIRLREATDVEAWETFVDIYAPVIHAYALRRGLQDADASDITQQVMRSVFKAIPEFEYDPQKGRFRGWLLTITRNHVLKSLQKRSRTPTATGDSDFHRTIQETSDPRGEEEAWNRDHEIHVFRWAAEKIKGEFRDATWNAFWRTAVENQSAGEVAESLSLSVGAVYIAKSRVLARLREVIEFAERDSV